MILPWKKKNKKLLDNTEIKIEENPTQNLEMKIIYLLKI